MKLLNALATPAATILTLAFPAHAAETDRPATPSDAKIEKDKRKVTPHSHSPDKSGVPMPATAPTVTDSNKADPATDMTKHHHPRDR